MVQIGFSNRVEGEECNEKLTTVDVSSTIQLPKGMTNLEGPLMLFRLRSIRLFNFQLTTQCHPFQNIPLDCENLPSAPFFPILCLSSLFMSWRVTMCFNSETIIPRVSKQLWLLIIIDITTTTTNMCPRSFPWLCWMMKSFTYLFWEF